MTSSWREANHKEHLLKIHPEILPRINPAFESMHCVLLPQIKKDRKQSCPRKAFSLTPILKTTFSTRFGRTHSHTEGKDRALSTRDQKVLETRPAINVLLFLPGGYWVFVSFLHCFSSCCLSSFRFYLCLWMGEGKSGVCVCSL